jgi:hypothetical protein
MEQDVDKIYAKLISLENEISNLRQGYMVVNQRYTETLNILMDLTNSAAEAAKKACLSAEQSAIATSKCSIAIKEATDK